MEMSEITITVDEDDGSDLFVETQKRLNRMGLEVADATSLTIQVDGDLDNFESGTFREVQEETKAAEVTGNPVELATEAARENNEDENKNVHNAGTKNSKRPDVDEIEEVLGSTEYVTKERIMRDNGDNPYFPVLEVLFSSRDPLRSDQIFKLTEGRGEGNLKRMWKNHLVDRQENDDDTQHWHKYTLAPRGKELILEIRKKWSRSGQLEDNMASIMG